MHISCKRSVGSPGQNQQLVRMVVGLSAGQSIHYNLSASCSDRGISFLLHHICEEKKLKKEKVRTRDLQDWGSPMTCRCQRTLFIRCNDFSKCPIVTAHEKCSLFRISDFLGVGASRLYILITSRMEEIKLKKNIAKPTCTNLHQNAVFKQHTTPTTM